MRIVGGTTEDIVAQEKAGEADDDTIEDLMRPSPGEQAALFPELDDSPEHKAILKLAKKLHKIRAERHAALIESKALEDKTQEDLVGRMHTATITKFKFKTIVVEIVERSEKVKVKLEVEEEPGDDDEA
jgi:high-affinity K+ transport system ATPase subunit B